MSELILIVEETKARRGRFDGWIEGFGQVVASSTQPFLDAARELIKRNVAPTTILMMRHKKTGTDSLRGPIDKAAKLEINKGRFAEYQGPRSADNLKDAAFLRRPVDPCPRCDRSRSRIVLTLLRITPREHR